MAVDRLRQMGDLQTPMVLRTAATLRLADLIAAGVTTAGGMAERTGTDRDALARLLRHMATIGLLGADGDGWCLTELGEALRSTHPSGVAGSLDANEVVGRIDLAHVRLLDAVRTGRAAYPLVHGRGFWEDLAADPALAARFDRHMSSGDVAPAVAAYDWSAVRHVVDVGGGSGRLLAGILEAAPHARGTLVELPGAAEAGRRRLAEAGLSGRAEVVAGTFFDPLPAGADVYVLANVLHDWGDAEAEAILRRCAEAAGIRGRVLVFQGVLDGVEDVDPGTGFDLFMLVCCGGRQRTLGEFEALGARADLRLTAASPVDLSFGHLMEFEPAAR
jgi:2,7-dihydroxy-5-methyl-1-naphthoate 7-O-methyltransferase